MNRNLSLPSGTLGASERLQKLLDDGGFVARGKGRNGVFASHFCVSTAAAQRYLSKDQIPANEALRVRIAKELNTSVGYWAYGEGKRQEDEIIDLIHGCVAAVLDELQLRKVETNTIRPATLRQMCDIIYRAASTADGEIDPQYAKQIVGLVVDLQTPK